MKTNDKTGRTISRRRLLKLAGLGGAGLALAACAPAAAPAAPAAPAASGEQPAPTTAPAAAGATNLRVLVCCATPAEEPLRVKFNTDFQAANPGVTVAQEAPPAGQNYFEKLQTLLAANQMPDVFDMWEGYVQPYAANGALMALDDLINTDTKIKTDDILPVVIPAQSYQGKNYAFVYGFMPGPVSLYYNVDHFTEAGMAEPTPDWTWNDVREAALKLTKKAGDTVEQWGLNFENWFVTWQHWIWSNGGDIFNAEQTAATLTDPKASEAVQWWYDLVNKDQVSPNADAVQALGNNATKSFGTGQISMRLGNYWDLGELKSSSTVNWKAVLAPKSNADQRVWYMHLGCWSISAQSQNANAAWAYARDFVLQRPIDSVTPYVPPLKSLLPTFTGADHEQLGYTALPEIVQQPGVLRIPGAGDRFDKIQGLIQAELDLAYIGRKTVAEAMAAAEPAVNEELARK
jgi:multiple sugar transport system substrate-binding protein